MATPTEEVKSRIDLVEYINEYVSLKQSGQNWKARCPFHNEKTPSFMVSRERGNWHCFGCGRGGDLFTFVQEFDGLEFPEALRMLAKRAGVELKGFDPKLQTQRTKVLDVLRWASRWYHEVLLKSKETEPIRNYLKERGLKDETIEDWEIGYAPSNLKATYEALKQKGFQDDDIFQAGLSIKNDRGAGYIDRFRGRIMFPIADPHGTVIGFSGRIFEASLDPNRPTPPKYINSPQTLVYNKSMTLFGLDKAKTGFKQSKKAVLVEGQMDCIMSHQAGVTNVVATGGTALTRDQVAYIKRFTEKLVFAFDQDAAGAQAVLRGVDQALRASVDVTVVTLPEGKDPDELIRNKPEAWQQAIEEAQPVMDYFFTQALEGRDMKKVQDKKDVARELLPILSKVSDPIEQSHYLERLAQQVGVEAETLRKSLEKKQTDLKERSTNVTPPAVRQPDRAQVLSERLVALLLREPRFFTQAIADLNPLMLVGEELQGLYKTLVVWYTERHVTSRAELERQVSTVDQEQQDQFTRLILLADKEFSDTSDVDIEQELQLMVAALKRRWLSGELRDLESSIRDLEARTDPQAKAALDELLERFQRVTTQLRELS